MLASSKRLHNQINCADCKIIHFLCSFCIVTNLKIRFIFFIKFNHLLRIFYLLGMFRKIYQTITIWIKLSFFWQSLNIHTKPNDWIKDISQQRKKNYFVKLRIGSNYILTIVICIFMFHIADCIMTCDRCLWWNKFNGKSGFVHTQQF